MKRWILAVIVVMSLPLQASEGLYVYLAALPYYWKQSNAGTSSEEKFLISTDMGLGYILADWVYFGGTFHYTNISLKQTVGTTPDDHQYTYQMYGPSLGYVGEQWFAIANYYAYAEQRDQNLSASPQSTTVRSGTGYGINVGYRFPIYGFELGPMLAYRSITYVNCKDPYSGATSTCDPASQQTEFTPYVVFMVNFK